MRDPMTSREQFEAEEAERMDEQAREMDYRHAEQFAVAWLRAWLSEHYFDASAEIAERQIESVRALLKSVSYELHDSRELHGFVADHGMPALLGVLSRATEQVR